MKLKIDRISRNQKTSRDGKPFESIGIQSGGEWYNGFGKAGVTDYWKEGDVIDVEIEEKEFNGKVYKNFKLPTLTSRVDKLEERVAKLENESNKF
jgi:hypothetical protein